MESNELLNPKSTSTVSNTSEPKIEENSIVSEPTIAVTSPPTQSLNQAQNLIVGGSQSKKGKIIFRIGASLLLAVTLFIFLTLGVPQIIGQIYHCAPFSENRDGCGTIGLTMFGGAGLLFFGIPITLISIVMIIYGNFKKGK